MLSPIKYRPVKTWRWLALKSILIKPLSSRFLLGNPIFRALGPLGLVPSFAGKRAASFVLSALTGKPLAITSLVASTMLLLQSPVVRVVVQPAPFRPGRETVAGLFNVSEFPTRSRVPS